MLPCWIEVYVFRRMGPACPQLGYSEGKKQDYDAWKGGLRGQSYATPCVPQRAGNQADIRSKFYILARCSAIKAERESQAAAVDVNGWMLQ